MSKCNSDTEIDFTEHWSFSNVQQEILRGQKLRGEKPEVNETEYDLIDVDFSVPACSKRKMKQSRSYQTEDSGRSFQFFLNFSCWYRIAGTAPSDSDSTHFFRKSYEYQNSPNGKNVTHRRYKKVTKKKRLKKLSTQKSKDPRCPLRIVELAEPLKRQCLNTWTNNYRVLPDYMVDRLRRHVEDKNPVVQISDAVNYFKRKKPTSKKCATKRATSKHSSEHNIRDILLLCTIFGYKVTRKLSSPANIILSPELAKINHIVSDEINSILRNKKSKNIYKNDKVLADISKKVTIWIASVLEESSYKQLLEQLDELEEEAGPVLDFIDELLDNIPIPSESSISSESIEENDITSIFSSKENIEDNKSINVIISKDTIDVEKPDYIPSVNIDQTLPTNVEDRISDNEIDNITEQIDMNNHFRSLLEDRIDYIIDNAGNTETKDGINVESVDSNNHFSSGMNKSNSDPTLNLENKQNNLAPDIDAEYISKNDTFISLNGFEADKTKTESESPGNKAELLLSMENDINEVPSNSESNNNVLFNDKEYIEKEDNKTLEDLEDDMREYNTTAVSSKTDLTPTMEHVINELPVTLKNNMNSGLPDKDKEYISQDEKFTLLDDNSETDRPKDISENTAQSDFLAAEVDDPQNDPFFKTDTVFEKEEEIVEGTKKVKFSDILRDTIRNNIGKNNRSELESHDFKPVVSKSSKEYISSRFNVAPPNPNLLSDMDEMWPDYLLPPLLKATESVSKSVTSLGKIMESDELSLASTVIKISVDNENSANKEPDSAKILPVDEDMIMFNKLDSKVLDDLLIEEFTKEWQRESKLITDKIIINNVNDPETLETKQEKITQDCGDVKNIKRDIGTQSDLLHPKTSLTNMLLSNIANMNNTSIKIDKNVQTSTVIIFSTDDELGLNNYYMKQWCIGLENVTANLELWAEWIQRVCVNASRLKHRESTSKNCQFTTKNINKWVDLKHSINSDVQRWFELKRHLHQGLKKYKTTYGTKQALSILADKKNCKCNKNFKKYMF